MEKDIIPPESEKHYCQKVSQIVYSYYGLFFLPGHIHSGSKKKKRLPALPFETLYSNKTIERLQKPKVYIPFKKVTERQSMRVPGMKPSQVQLFRSLNRASYYAFLHAITSQ